MSRQIIPWTTKEQKWVVDSFQSGMQMRKLVEEHNRLFAVRSYDCISQAIHRFMNTGRKHTYTKYTKEMDAYLKKNCGLPRKILAEKMNEKFGTKASAKSVAVRLSNMGYYWLEKSDYAVKPKYIRGMSRKKYDE